MSELLFEPRPLTTEEAGEGWIQFEIIGKKAIVVLWVRPESSVACGDCGSAYAVHSESLEQLAQAIGSHIPSGNQIVCLCEGKMVE